MSEKEKKARPEDHPEVHLWQVLSEDYFDIRDDILWCPHCGAWKYREKDTINLPDISLEGYRDR